jgi:hypothetical protein
MVTMSLFMLWIRANDCNLSMPMNQLTFCTNVTDESSYFHIFLVGFENSKNRLFYDEVFQKRKFCPSLSFFGRYVLFNLQCKIILHLLVPLLYFSSLCL